MDVIPSRVARRYRLVPNEDDLAGLPPAAQAYIRELETRAAAAAQRMSELAERIKVLEEQSRRALSKRFASSSWKLKHRVFDEAEQAAHAEPGDGDAGAQDKFVLSDQVARCPQIGTAQTRSHAAAGSPATPAQ